MNSSKAGNGQLGPMSQVGPDACSQKFTGARTCSLPGIWHCSGRAEESQQTPCGSRSLQNLLSEPLQEKSVNPCSPQSFSLETGDMVGASGWLLTSAQIMISEVCLSTWKVREAVKNGLQRKGSLCNLGQKGEHQRGDRTLNVAER